jgi:hypothetical protein
MLPFLKNRDDGIGVGDVETKEREHDEDFDLLGMVAEDIIGAVEKKDAKQLRAALEALCEHIQDLDAAQDQAMETAE